MNKDELIERLAKQSHQSKGKAADQVDTLVYGLLKDLKQVPAKPPTKASEKNAPKPPSAPKSPSVAPRGKK